MTWAGPLDKPEPRKRIKARRKRQEAKVVADVRPQCVARDGYCRVSGWPNVGPCKGASAWSHFGEKKRFKTRKMDPRYRHTTAGSLMLCNDAHHWAYDKNKLELVALNPVAGCDGRLRATTDAGTYEETECPRLPQ